MPKTDRRAFLLQSSLSPLMLAQTAASSEPVPRDVADFWINKVGLSPDSTGRTGVMSAGAARTGLHRHDPGAAVAGYGQEPLFLYVDMEQNKLVPASELPATKLLPPGDATVDIRLTRLRLNEEDQGRFDKFQSGGVYLDLEQKTTTPDAVASLTWSMLSAIFPAAKTSAPRPTAAAPQQPGALQTISLPDGAGSATFCCFLKDRRRSPFGRIADAFLDLTNQATPDIMPLLLLPALAAPAIKAVRSLVFNLQAHGGQDWLFQDSPIPLVCTAAPAAPPEAIRLRTGHYIVIPKSQSALLKGSLTDLKVVDGFLVPKSAGVLDVFDAAPVTAKGISYLSLYVNAKKARLNRCPA